MLTYKRIVNAFVNANLKIKHYRFFFYFLERWQMPVKANIYKIIKIFCFFFGNYKISYIFVV